MAGNLPITDAETVGALIPQKTPFVMVDGLLDYSETALTSTYTPKDSDIFAVNGIFEASGVLEHQAQSVALHTGYKFFLAGEAAPVGYIGAVKSFKINRLPKISEQMMTNVTIIAELDGVTLVKTDTEISGELIASSEMKTVIA